MGKYLAIVTLLLANAVHAGVQYKCDDDGDGVSEWQAQRCAEDPRGEKALTESPSREKPKSYRQRMQVVADHCAQAIASHMKDPSSMRWNGKWERRYRTNADGKSGGYSLYLPMDFKNGFGAYSGLETFECPLSGEKMDADRLAVMMLIKRLD